MEETISLKELYQVLKKRLLIIILSILLSTTVAGLLSYYILTPQYEASSQILVNEKKAGETAYQSNDIQTNLQLINTYTVIITSPSILDRVISLLNLNLSADALKNQITVSSEKDSQVMNITVKSKNPKQAILITNTIADVAKQEIPTIMSINNVSILTKADPEKKLSPVSPRKKLNLAIGVVVGAMVGVGIAFLLHYLDNTIKDEEDLEKVLDFPYLGTVYDSGRKRKKKGKRGVALVKDEEKNLEAFS